MEIGVGYVIKLKDRDMEENTREGRITRVRKELVGCVQDGVGNKKV